MVLKKQGLNSKEWKHIIHGLNNANSEQLKKIKVVAEQQLWKKYEQST